MGIYETGQHQPRGIMLAGRNIKAGGYKSRRRAEIQNLARIDQQDTVFKIFRLMPLISRPVQDSAPIARIALTSPVR